jgi:hypothetical protein
MITRTIDVRSTIRWMKSITRVVGRTVAICALFRVVSLWVSFLSYEVYMMCV